ncbi:CvpA family protein [Pullulanibacillus sp. KACC 23026]|uniref:CvpA family protein n=1 Tax=Pullulanibacillus sp. KACC 23026 TaxID=3028315 RepID=UPI0023AEE0D7|nr:CvpA family protein [Pullulanibacillus sp. KACC 23026]WEG13933.1 CvpA family protein [Pullulanibacillus sp. KACC 23026]
MSKSLPFGMIRGIVSKKPELRKVKLLEKVEAVVVVNLIILILLVVGFAIGARRGLILQLVHFTGFVAAYVIAYNYAGQLAPKLQFWIPYSQDSAANSFFSTIKNLNLEMSFYHAVAFTIIFIVVKIVWQILGSMLDFLADLPILRSINRLLGALFGFVEVYLVLFVLLYIGALMPYFHIDQYVHSSSVALFMVQHTPGFSQTIQHLWFQYTGANPLT